MEYRMPLKVGDKVPAISLKTLTPEGMKEINLHDLSQGKKVVVFAVPGAFTPTCSKEHLPGYQAQSETYKARGVDVIACLSVNDAFVMEAWRAQSAPNDHSVMMLADGNGEFTKEAGLDLNATGHGMGIRSRRYAMLIESGIVKALDIEPEVGCTISHADSFLKHLQ